MSKTADNTPDVSPPLTPCEKKDVLSNLANTDDANTIEVNQVILREPGNTGKDGSSNSGENILHAHKKDRTKKPKKPRCALEGCRKKLRITDTKCRCDKIFCHKHRCAVDHKCAKLHEKDDHETHSKLCGLGGGTFSKLDRI